MTQTVIALDVGGTGIKCALVGLDGTVQHAERHATGRERGAEAVVATILDIAEGLAATARTKGLEPVGAGLVVPGVIDEVNGVAVWAANVGFRDVPLKAKLEERLGLPAALGHDVRAGGLAEARLGAGRGHDYVLFIPVGTGIAAANVVHGQVYTGAHGAAGEIGHIVVRPGGPQCQCGQRGCLESIASASAVGRRYSEQAGRPATAEEVAKLASDGDPVAVAVWQETIDALADGLLIGMALFDPAVIVLGGGLAEAGEALLAPLRDGVKARVTFHREPAITRAALGDEAGCQGAALIALDKMNRSTR
ncbi:ROK family protein [Dactylosporangium sp. AC04546]|uniref:ROK family protein n=1 Tax=Dactylosporangium sp. AC04546 TaxID=2862460 RepID=UPI001EDDDD81|nr:ROK family protein [Dactylosporangium sp. AC04546]WVK84387.1 ROK family protein [Dactylosporangium sp. AC04546]